MNDQGIPRTTLVPQTTPVPQTTLVPNETARPENVSGAHATEFVPQRRTTTDMGTTPERLLDRLFAVELMAADAELLSRYLSDLALSRRAVAERALASLPAQDTERISWVLGDAGAVDTGDIFRIQAHGASLIQSYEALTADYDTMLGQMARLGFSALKNGLRASGRERDDEFRDALKLLQGVLDHPIGGRNHAVWFALAFTRWATGAAASDVEEGFYQAARLSATTRDPWHVFALRHLMHIQLLQNRAIDAFETARRIPLPDSDPETAVEVARAAVRCGDSAAARERLTAALDTFPGLALAVFSEPDLISMVPDTCRILAGVVDGIHEAADRAHGMVELATETAREVENRIGVRVSVPQTLLSIAPRKTLMLHEAQKQEGAIRSDCQAFFASTVEAIEVERAAAEISVNRVKKLIDQAMREKTYWEGSVKSIEEDARLAGYSLHPYSFQNPLFRKKNLRAEQARVFYESCKQNLEKAVGVAETQVPRLEADHARHSERLRAIDETLAWVKARSVR